MTRILVLSTCLLVAGSAWAQDKARALVCPPSLNYCYYVEKPIREKPTRAENTKAAWVVIRCMERENAVNAALNSLPLVDYNCKQYHLPE